MFSITRIETVPRLYTKVRPALDILLHWNYLKMQRYLIKKFTKSGIMVGLGETKEVIQVMDDLRSAEVDFITIGQYLQPSAKHHPLDRYHPDEFKNLRILQKQKVSYLFLLAID